MKNGVLKKFANFTGKHLCWSIKKRIQSIKKRLQYRCFPVKFAKFLRTLILKNICERLLQKRVVLIMKKILLSHKTEIKPYALTSKQVFLCRNLS